MDPEEVRRFAKELKRFNDDMQTRAAALHARFVALTASWQDQEQEKFVDHRYSKNLVRRLTLLTGNELDSFMRLYRPSVTFTRFASDYDFQSWIKQAFFRFQNGMPPLPFLKEEEEEE